MSERPWAEGGADKPFSVTLWDTHPDLEEDTCNTGIDFATLEEAKAAFHNIEPHFPGLSQGYWRHTPFVMMDGPGLREVRQREGIKPRQERDEVDHEFAMQQGMGLGIQAYNEAMGFDSEEYDPSLYGR